MLFGIPMKRFILVVTLLSACSTEQPPPVVGEINIIPQPLAVRRIGGTFSVGIETAIVAVSESEVRVAEMLTAALSERIPGASLRVIGTRGTPKAIEFVETASADGDAKLDAAYRLTIAPTSVKISGTARGMFYGVQSLLQMLPANGTLPVELPAAEIDDRPRFEYRGMHLDVARHFMPVEFVKRYIDHLARYKLNYFHWHLTDDQGWRIEIRAYPLLTEKGSVRPESALSKANEPFRGNGTPVRGYYSQEKIREVVEYARSRHITIVPEIDMPGHASAALAAYPELGCRSSPDYKVKKEWGAFPDILCPTPETFVFVENVLSELIELFPDSPFIHIGGDEVKFHDQWRASTTVQRLKAAEGLDSERDVEAYFVRRVSEIVESKGRKAIGWDEVIDRPAPNMTVMAWQAPDRGRLAASMGHKVIMTPWQNTYFDHLPGDLGPSRVALGDPVPLEAVYRFDPAPREFGLAARNIIGGQACLWTEFLYEPADVEFMLFPRLLALSESLWSMPESKNLGDFYRRMSFELGSLDQRGIPFFVPVPFGFAGRQVRPNERVVLEMASPVDRAAIYFTQDGSDPGESSELYRMPVIVEMDGASKVVKALVVLPSGRRSTVFEAEFDSAVRQPLAGPLIPREIGRYGSTPQALPDPSPAAPTRGESPPGKSVATPRPESSPPNKPKGERNPEG